VERQAIELVELADAAVIVSEGSDRNERRAG